MQLSTFDSINPTYVLMDPTSQLPFGQLSISNPELPWTNAKKVKKALCQHSDLPNKKIEAIVQYVGAHLHTHLEKARSNREDIRLSPSETGLPLFLEINKEGYAQLPLKKWGQMLGKGEFRTTKTAITLTDPDMPLTAHATERLMDNETYSDSEVLILQKIALFLNTYPQAKGLLRFYSLFDYETAKSPRFVVPNGYDEEIRKQPLPTKTIKRATATKLYNFGNLKDRLKSLNLENRIQVAQFLLAGLSYLHWMKIFHSDIKIENMFIEWDEEHECVTEAVIGDFGFACDLTNPNDRFFKNGDKICRPPELKRDVPIQGMPIDETILAADVYAMGLLLKTLFYDVESSPLNDLIHRMTADPLTDRPTASAARKIFKAML